VDKPEIMAALKVLGVKASKQEIEGMIRHVDTKNSGSPVIAEFLQHDLTFHRRT
jgi:Ca2+-binding EF-hand superfamily protein